MLTAEPKGIHRRTSFVVTEALRTRFLAKVQCGLVDECWEWQGSRRNSYGAIKHGGQVLGTHVVAYVIANGDIPSGCIVTHNCDNRLCCNPSHLRAGTPSSNVREAWDRRAINACRGEKSPNAKLVGHDVQLIRSLHLSRCMGALRISRLVKQNVNTIKNVLSRQSWRHIDWPSKEDAQAIVASFFGKQVGVAAVPVVEAKPQIDSLGS